MPKSITPSSNNIAAGMALSTPVKGPANNAEKSSSKIKVFINSVFSKIAAFFRAFIGLFYKKENQSKVTPFNDSSEEDDYEFYLDESDEHASIINNEWVENKENKEANEEENRVVGEDKKAKEEETNAEKGKLIRGEGDQTLIQQATKTTKADSSSEENKNAELEKKPSKIKKNRDLDQEKDPQRLDSSHLKWKKVALYTTGAAVLALGIFGWYYFSSSASDQSSFDFVGPKAGNFSDSFLGGTNSSATSILDGNVPNDINCGDNFTFASLQRQVASSGEVVFEALKQSAANAFNQTKDGIWVVSETLNQSVANVFNPIKDGICEVLSNVSKPVQTIAEQPSSEIWATIKTGFYAFKAAGDSI